MKPTDQMTVHSEPELPLVDGMAFRSPIALLNELQVMDLPVIVKVGRSRFKVTQENLGAIGLGILLATDEAWE